MRSSTSPTPEPGFGEPPRSVYDHLMFAAPVWHYWIGVAVVLLALVATVALFVQYLRKTQSPKYGPDQ
jgi:hypothetical protein